MPSSSAHAPKVIVATPDDDLWGSFHDLLRAVGMEVRRVDGPPFPPAGSDGPSPDVLLLDETQADVPGMIRAARESGWIAGATPVLVLARNAPERTRLLEWLQAGAWDWVRVPLDEELLALRVRNLLLSRTTVTGHAGRRDVGGYDWKGLVRVAQESLALARRHGRPLCCVAVRLDWPEEPPEMAARSRLLERLQEAIHESVRGSDLLGRSPDDELVMLLPDTDRPGAELVARRLQSFVGDRLEEWGRKARVRVAVSAAADHPDAPAHAFLDTAVRHVE